MLKLINLYFYPLTLRRPLRQSWRLGVFSGSHGSALAAIPKRWKNIPHKSGMADFFKYFFFLVECLCTPQNAFENFRLRFYLLWCLLIFGFWLLSQSNCFFFDLETYFETFKVHLSYQRFLFKLFFLKYNDDISWIRSLLWKWKDSDSSFCDVTHLKQKISQQKSKRKN